jgi:hypothetical protein
MDNGIAFFYGADWRLDPNDPLPEPGGFCCTSGATPVIAGAAQLYRDMFITEFSTLIDDPGILYANMLLWGDRTYETIGFSTSGYSGLWGAGKLRLRAPVNLDPPSRWATGRTCLPASGEFTHVMTPGGPLSPNVDVMRLVVWWYDHRHDSGTDNDTIRLWIDKRLPPATTWTVHVSTSITDDNRKRYHEDFPASGYEYRFRLDPISVTSDVEGCGSNSAFVHWAYFWEGSDRATSSLIPIRPENDPE